MVRGRKGSGPENDEEQERGRLSDDARRFDEAVRGGISREEFGRIVFEMFALPGEPENDRAYRGKLLLLQHVRNEKGGWRPREEQEPEVDRLRSALEKIRDMPTVLEQHRPRALHDDGRVAAAIAGRALGEGGEDQDAGPDVAGGLAECLALAERTECGLIRACARKSAAALRVNARLRKELDRQRRITACVRALADVIADMIRDDLVDEKKGG